MNNEILAIQFDSSCIEKKRFWKLNEFNVSEEKS